MTDTNLPAERPRISATAMTMSSTGGGGVPMPVTFGEVIALADVMSRSQHAIPKHLRENPGACLAVTMQAMRWEMDPFAVAAKTYSVKDQVAYEAQVISAVINTRAGLIRRPKIEYRGEGPTRQCVVTGEFFDGSVGVYESPEVGKITTKNSPLWASDTDQQLAYFSIRSFGRRYCPEVILGVYDRDEIDASEIVRDVTPQRGTSSGLLAKMQSTTTDAEFTEGFGIRDIDKEAGEPAPAAEPRKRGRPKKEAEASAPNLAENVGESEVGKPTSEQNQPLEDAQTLAQVGAEVAQVEPISAQVDSDDDVGITDAIEEAPETPADAQVEDAAPVEPEPPVEASSDLFQAETIETVTLTHFEVFDAAAADAKGWDDLRPAMMVLTQTEEWKAKPHDQKKARARVWELVQRWNEDGAKLDPAADAFLFQAFVSTSTDVEVITGTLEVVKGQKWYLDAPEDRQASVRRFVAGRIEEIGRGA